MSEVPAQSIISRNIEEELKESYLRYSMSVIISRALPDVRDGLKPSQRRILFAMRQLNLSASGKHRKCAKICGDTSGDFHPHGETVVYPTLARMAQHWVMRYRLVDGQGNFGSIDGDSPPAMRYTEARLTTASIHLMEDLDKETVDYIPNYDETKVEPTVFPAKFPNLLCNGSSGIAVGMATNIPPHNLRELVDATLLVIDDPTTTIEQIFTVMPGPDFPTGGVICGYRGIKEAYHTGRGKIILRAKVRTEAMKGEGERQRIVIDELPYNVNKARLIERIAELIHDKAITGISDLRDESDKDGMRVSIELKRNEMPDVIINQLYRFTDMQVTFGCQMLALDKGLPRLMNVKHMIAAWVDHRIEVIRRRTRFELAKAEARAHLLEGYLKALDHLDEVVRIIRASPNREVARYELVARFAFSERQANAVLDLRLYQLTGLEREKIESEYAELQIKIAHLKEILAHESLVRGIIKEELLALKNSHKSERATQIIAAEGEFQIEDLIADEPVMITLSTDDYIRRLPLDTFREQRRGGQGVAGMDMKRETDALKDLFVASTHDQLVIFTNLGRCYWLKVWKIPETGRRSKGKPLVNLLEEILPDEKIATILAVRDFLQEVSIVLTTRRGVVKKTELAAYSNMRKKGVFAINIDEGDELINARLVHPEQQIMLFTKKGMAVRFDASTVRQVGRVARGVRGVTLKSESDAVIGSEVVNGDETILVVCAHGYGKRSNVEEFRKTNRGGSGVRSIITSERNGDVVAALKVSDEDSLVMMSAAGQGIRIPVRGIRVMGRATQGVRLANLRPDDLIVAVQKVPAEEDEEVPAELEEASGVPDELEEAEEVIVEDESLELDEIEEEEPDDGDLS